MKKKLETAIDEKIATAIELRLVEINRLTFALKVEVKEFQSTVAAFERTQAEFLAATTQKETAFVTTPPVRH